MQKMGLGDVLGKFLKILRLLFLLLKKNCPRGQ